VVLVVGYRRNHRNLMLVAAILLLLSCALTQGAAAFNEGFLQAWGGSP